MVFGGGIEEICMVAPSVEYVELIYIKYIIFTSWYEIAR